MRDMALKDLTQLLKKVGKVDISMCKPPNRRCGSMQGKEGELRAVANWRDGMTSPPRTRFSFSPTHKLLTVNDHPALVDYLTDLSASARPANT